MVFYVTGVCVVVRWNSQRGEDEEMGEQIVDGGMGKRTRSGEGVGG